MDNVDLAAVADAVAEATGGTGHSRPLPKPLPPGWVLKSSQSQPGYGYYFHIPTGLTSWHPPLYEDEANQQEQDTQAAVEAATRLQEQQQLLQQQQQQSEQPKPDLPPPTSEDPETAPDRSSKRRKPASSSNGPKEVRVLHILKKHKGSRRPSSWRQPKVTATLEEAKEELSGLLEILLEEEGNFDELKATFEELARTESDCSSAKRGGDLGFFGRRKMQPAFEAASFALPIGGLTKELVETSSGVHLILRIG